MGCGASFTISERLSHPMPTPRGKVLWTPPAERVARSQLKAFAALASRRAGRTLSDYAGLHRWSVEDIPAFWRAVWDDAGVVHEGEISSVLSQPSMPGARWFEGARLSYSENLLRHAGPGPALIFEGEDEQTRRVLSRDELRAAVARARAGLERLGVRAGDRVVAFTPNLPEAVIAMLAAASLGAIWSSTSPDFGPQGVLDRFGQIAPRVLFAADGYVYAGKRHALGERLRHILEHIPSIEAAVIYEHAGPRVSGLRGQLAWDEFLGGGAPQLAHARLPFDHPLFILYTSGTTGVPKCIVHGTGGTLLKHLEEHRLQVDLHAGDAFFYFTTCGWMMWNWLASGLAVGAAVVLYDGSPLHPDPGRLFRLIDRNRIGVFGVSPRFLSAVEGAGVVPRRDHSLASLKTVLSTGSPLHAPQFEWVYRAVKEDVALHSISGGTDLIGCFVAGSPFHAIRAGEIPCRALGMKVESLDEEGRPVVGEKGELACAATFPSMPVGFWNDPDGSKYRSAYFARYPGKWHHGDFIEFREDGAAVIHGRSDATLNPGGVRIGTAEIYRALAAVPEVAEGLAVGRQTGGDERVVLFVVLRPGARLDQDLERRIREAIRASTSPRHVPAEIHAIPEVPRTLSGKSVEIAAARVLRGEEVTNRDALANPEALDYLKRFAGGG
jgi:acetoacetyl-CoA synthetase